MRDISLGTSYAGDVHRAYMASSDSGEQFVAFDMRGRGTQSLAASHQALVAQKDGDESLSYQVQRDDDGEVWVTFRDTLSGNMSAFLVSDAQLASFESALNGTAYAFSGGAGATDDPEPVSSSSASNRSNTVATGAQGAQSMNEGKAVGDVLDVNGVHGADGKPVSSGYQKGALLNVDFSALSADQVPADFLSLVQGSWALSDISASQKDDSFVSVYTYQNAEGRTLMLRWFEKTNVASGKLNYYLDFPYQPGEYFRLVSDGQHAVLQQIKQKQAAKTTVLSSMPSWLNSQLHPPKGVDGLAQEP